MAEDNSLRAANGGPMRVIATKSGSALVSLRLVPTCQLRELIPQPLVVQSLLPGLALYAVSAFHYSRICIGHEEGSVRSWSDVTDVAIMVPVRCPDRSSAWFVERLYNTSPEVVAWAAGHRLPKIPAVVDWQWNGRDIRVRMDCPTGTGEWLELHGRRWFRLPAWIWNVGPLRAVERSALLSRDVGAIRRFAVGCKTIGRATYSSVSCATDGIALPAPWLSFGCVIDSFTDFAIEAPQPT